MQPGSPPPAAAYQARLQALEQRGAPPPLGEPTSLEAAKIRALLDANRGGPLARLIGDLSAPRSASAQSALDALLGTLRAKTPDELREATAQLVQSVCGSASGSENALPVDLPGGAASSSSADEPVVTGSRTREEIDREKRKNSIDRLRGWVTWCCARTSTGVVPTYRGGGGSGNGICKVVQSVSRDAFRFFFS